MTGSPHGVLDELEAKGQQFYWATGEVSPRVFSILPVSGHALAHPSQERRRLLADALHLIAQLDGPYLDSVEDFLGVAIWLECRSPGQPSLASSSFPALPHACFWTDLAAIEILPDAVLDEPRAWALAESLYHESLHQRLSATLLQREILSEHYEASTAPSIAVPWRGTRWPPDRVLHAVFVYTRLMRMRAEYVERDKLDAVERAGFVPALRQGAEALAYLSEQLPGFAEHFTAEGNHLVAEILEESRGVLQRVA